MRTRILLLVCMMNAWCSAANCTPSKAPSHSPSTAPTHAPGPSHSSSPKPSPSDCTSVIFHMTSCISFLNKDSKLTKPDSKCCSGFKSVLHTGFECICTAVKSSARMGLALNMTKASTLSSSCGVSAPPLSHCNAKPHVSPSKIAPSPESPRGPSTPSKPPSAKTPVHSPGPSKPPSGKTPGPSPGGDAPKLAPTPSTLGGTHSMSASLTFVIINMFVASFSLVSA